MNRYCKEDDSEDSQSFSPEYTMDTENNNEESQSILPSFNKNCQNKSTFIRSEVSAMFKEKENPQSHPLFSETENDLVNDVVEAHTKKRHIVSDTYQSESHSTEKRSKSDQNKYCQTDNAIKSEILSVSHEDKSLDVNCIECIFDKDLDKRNYYFGNLLIGELQFIPPCIRSEAYVTILKYVDSLKKKHRSKENVE